MVFRTYTWNTDAFEHKLEQLVTSGNIAVLSDTSSSRRVSIAGRTRSGFVVQTNWRRKQTHVLAAWAMVRQHGPSTTVELHLSMRWLAVLLAVAFLPLLTFAALLWSVDWKRPEALHQWFILVAALVSVALLSFVPLGIGLAFAKRGISDYRELVQLLGSGGTYG